MSTRERLKQLPRLALLLSALIHLLPLSGLAGGPALARLYGIHVADANTAILLQHRAWLFGMLALWMLAAVFRRPLQPAAMGVGLFSAAGFVGVAWWVGGYNVAIARVVLADGLVSVLLGVAWVAQWRQGRT